MPQLYKMPTSRNGIKMSDENERSGKSNYLEKKNYIKVL